MGAPIRARTLPARAPTLARVSFDAVFGYVLALVLLGALAAVCALRVPVPRS